ncbi:helix-turn-helix transcriptional regulator [uncultured Marivirga sp.]|uniref:response regulator transcription factor n=1 Tax=uncultured Marivirga sp. TaxID=1123707 RepID=UPI0030EF5A14|tara:strand:+ start:353121 stop:354059 length:939 start_codon:yes stop_codon:yes gene_type:complete
MLGLEKSEVEISGKLTIDDSWDSKIYLSHIPTFDDMYLMSNEMILAAATIDSLGYFQFHLDFLPKSDNLYRLHLIKKGDSRATLIIGGKNENHLFIIANSESNLELINTSKNPPFRQVSFMRSSSNSDFQKVTQLLFFADSIASESSASKRALLESELQKDLQLIADTSNNLLVSLYALCNSDLNSRNPSNIEFLETYFSKWDNTDSEYLKAFRSELPVKDQSSNSYLLVVTIVLMSTVIGFLIFRTRFKKASDLEKLSIQERKIFEVLQRGASNQEISDHFNIGLSTVKSHLSSIYSKLNVKSRKDIVDLK